MDVMPVPSEPSELVIEEHEQVSKADLVEIKNLYLDSFPLRYGDYFYDSLHTGKYGGQPLITCIARRDGRIIGACCSTLEEEGGGSEETRMVERGDKAYLMTLAVEKE